MGMTARALRPPSRMHSELTELAHLVILRAVDNPRHGPCHADRRQLPWQTAFTQHADHGAILSMGAVARATRLAAWRAASRHRKLLPSSTRKQRLRESLDIITLQHFGIKTLKWY